MRAYDLVSRKDGEGHQAEWRPPPRFLPTAVYVPGTPHSKAVLCMLPSSNTETWPFLGIGAKAHTVLLKGLHGFPLHSCPS